MDRVSTFILERRSGGGLQAHRVRSRYNARLAGEPSFTLLSNRCVHLGCPVQPGGSLVEDAQDGRGQGGGGPAYPVTPANFGCPCHGGPTTPREPYRRSARPRARPLLLRRSATATVYIVVYLQRRRGDGMVGTR